MRWYTQLVVKLGRDALMAKFDLNRHRGMCLSIWIVIGWSGKTVLWRLATLPCGLHVTMIFSAMADGRRVGQYLDDLFLVGPLLIKGLGVMGLCGVTSLSCSEINYVGVTSSTHVHYGEQLPFCHSCYFATSQVDY